MSRWRFMVVAIVLVAALGCSRERKVPFGLVQEEPEPDKATQPDEEPPIRGQVFEPGTQLALATGAVTAPIEEGYLLASYEVDLNADGALDLFYASATEEQLQLGTALQGDGTLRRRTIETVPQPPNCKEPRAVFQVIDPNLMLASMKWTCPSGERSAAWMLSMEDNPRIRERIELLPPNSTHPAQLSLTVTSEDKDQDGHSDAIVTFGVDGNEVPIAWLDRPGGFARERSQPEQTIAELAMQAKGAQTIERARDALLVFSTLCATDHAARVNLKCDPSPGAGLAASALIHALVTQQRFVEAREAMRWLKDPHVAVGPEERERVTQAWKKAKTPSTLEWRAVDSETGNVDLAFLNGSTLRIRGKKSRQIDLDSGTRTTTAAVPPPVHDPSKTFAVSALYRTCRGYEAEIESLSGPGRRRNRVLIASDPLPPPCGALRERPVTSDEWHVLGWAPQGLLVARETKLRVVPLDTQARPAGDPVDLGDGALPPAPLSGQIVTPTGSHYLLVAPEGILIRRVGTTEATWIRPSDWESVRGSVRSVALSPDAAKIAIHKGAEIRVIRW